MNKIVVKAMRDGRSIPYNIEAETYSEALDKAGDDIRRQIANDEFPYDKVILFDSFGDVAITFEPQLN